MERKLMYEKVRWEKDCIGQILEKKDFEDALEGFSAFVHNRDNKFVDQVAVATVLESGSLDEDWRWGYSFMMPATACCMENFKTVRKELSRGKRLGIPVFDENYNVIHEVHF